MRGSWIYGKPIVMSLASVAGDGCPKANVGVCGPPSSMCGQGSKSGI